MLDGLRDWTDATDPVWQWVVVMIAGAIPFVESYFAGPLGVLAGMLPALAIAAAIVGNIISMVLVVLLSGRVRSATGADERELSPRRERFKQRFDRWGVPGVSLLGQTLLPSQITSGLMVGFGASRRQVIIWQIVSIALWGIGFGLLAVGGVALLEMR
ncbi:MAG: hypothetical protein KIT89_02220 [Microcella sp.]|nr:hypothetical protein [Microcella sp.]UYN84899.1 MAG: hypothetical protein KIT89_02220 [Microcella sp.]